MSKVLNLELSKRLNDLGLLDNIETEYIYHKIKEGSGKGKIIVIQNFALEGKSKEDIKTLTLEEAIEFLPKEIDKHFLNFGPLFDRWYIQYQHGLGDINHGITGNNLIESIEKMIEYLLDNNLLTK